MFSSLWLCGVLIIIFKKKMLRISVYIQELLTISNCFKYADVELFACMRGWPLLNIAQITIPNENISLNILQFEVIWISGAVSNLNVIMWVFFVNIVIHIIIFISFKPLPIKSKFGCSIFDWRELQDWQITDSTASFSLARSINSNPANFHVPFFVIKMDDGHTFLCITWPE